MTTGGTLTFNDGEFVDVSVNGVALVAGTDYNTTTANTIGGLSALSANDQVEIVVYDTFSVFGGNVDADFNINNGNLSVSGTSTLTGAVTASGGATLSSSSSGEFNALTISQADNTSGNESRIRFKRTTDAGSDREVAAIVADRAGGNDTALVFETNTDGSDGATERVRIDQDGKVGIGETAPLGTLHVRTSDASLSSVNANADDLILENNGNCGMSICSSTSGEGNLNFIDSGDTNIGRIQYTHSDNNMIFRANDTEAMRIDSSGNVGIGTTSPTQPLSISANGANGLFLVRDEGDAADSCRLFFDSSNTRYALFAKDGVLSVRSGGTPGSSSGTERVQFTVNGINSSGVAGNTTVSSANLFISGGNNFQKSTSSRRYKTNITDATHGLSDVLNLRSVTYKGVNDGETVFGGLIAEEVHDAGLTEFVNYSQDDDGNDIPEGVHYGHMVALAFKAIQELKTELDAEKVKTAALTTRIETLETGE
jgi:hypothetical protein